MCRTSYSSLSYSNGYFPSVQLFKSFAPLNGPFPPPHISDTTTQQSAVHISHNICISSLPYSIKSLPLVHSPNMENANNTSSTSVQRVNKKSSDELLKKFADDEPAPIRLAKRRKRREVGSDSCESPNSHSNTTSLTERRSLLPPVASKSALLRKFRVGGSRLRPRGIKNKSLFGTIQKTWRRTIEGASRVFMEKHYNRHRRLINDVV